MMRLRTVTLPICRGLNRCGYVLMARLYACPGTRLKRYQAFRSRGVRPRAAAADRAVAVWCFRRATSICTTSATATGSQRGSRPESRLLRLGLEDVEREQRGNGRVRHVYDLGEAQVDGDAHERVRRLAAESALERQVVEHGEQCPAGSEREVERLVAAILVDRQSDGGERRADGEPRRLVDRERRAPGRLLPESEADGDRAGHLNARAAHLALALGEVEVADGEERAGDVDGKQEAAARHELRHVEVAAELTRRDRPEAAGRLRREGRLWQVVGDGAAACPQLLLAHPHARDRFVRGGDAGHAGERGLRDCDAGELRAGGTASLDLPLDQVGVGEEVGEVAEPGDHGGDAEVRRPVREKLDLEEVAGLGALDPDGPGKRVPEPEVKRPGVLVGAVPPELAGEPVLRLEGQLLAGRYRRDGLQLRMPAVVHVRARGARGRARRRRPRGRARPWSTAAALRAGGARRCPRGARRGRPA